MKTLLLETTSVGGYGILPVVEPEGENSYGPLFVPPFKNHLIIHGHAHLNIVKMPVHNYSTHFFITMHRFDL